MRAVIVDETSGEFPLLIQETAEPNYAEDEVLIEVKAAGVNRADTLQRRGLYPPPPNVSPILGLEVAGIVKARGKNVKNFQIGDRVCALLQGGGYASLAVSKASTTILLPENYSFIEGAAFAEAYLVAYLNIFQEATIDKNDVIYINAAASGIGLAAIQLCTLFGARIVCSCGTDEKVSFIKNMGVEHVINYKKENVRKKIEDIFGKRSVNVIFDMVAGDTFEDSLSLLATDGRLVMIGYQAGRNSSIDFAKILIKRLHVIGSTLRSRSDNFKENLVSDFKNKFWQYVENGKLKPHIDATFKLEDVEKAHTHMLENRNIGKIILTV